MVGRELYPAAFPELELEEVVLSPLNTRIIGRAIFDNDGSALCTRGGVAAHDIGFGKTVVVIALLELLNNFDSGQSIIERVETATRLWNLPKSTHPDPFFHLKATLIIVPGHISDQWISEFRKFGSLANILKIPDIKALERKSLQELKEADVIIVSEGLFRSAAYLDALDRLDATPGSRSRPTGREAHDRYHVSREMIRAAVRHYNRDGAAQLVESTNQALKQSIEGRRQTDLNLSQEHIASFCRNKAGVARRRRTDVVSTEALVGDGSKGNGDEKEARGSGNNGVGKERGQSRKRKAPPNDQEEVLWHPTKFLENFSFARIVVDEYSYQGASTISFLSGSLAYAKWLLSGTPPYQNLANIAEVGLALGVHVARPEPSVQPGLPPVTEGPRLHPMSASEEFRSFSCVKSADFALERHGQGLKFVKHFYRSNKADHSSIPIREVVVPVKLHAHTAVYYNVAHLEICDGNGNLLQVPIELRTLLSRFNIAATGSGEAAAGLALTAVANGVVGDNQWFVNMADTLFGLMSKFKTEAKFYFDKLVWLLDRADSVNPGVHNDKYQVIRMVAKSIIHDFVKSFRGEKRDLSRYGGAFSFVRLMTFLAPPTKQRRTPQSFYLAPSNPSDFDPRLWRRDMALTCWLDWYNIEPTEVSRLDREELVHLASDLVILGYSSKKSASIHMPSIEVWLNEIVEIIKPLLSGGGYENLHLRQNSPFRSIQYEQSAKGILLGLDSGTLTNFIVKCQAVKTEMTESLLDTRSIRIDNGNTKSNNTSNIHKDVNRKTKNDGRPDKATLREQCRVHNLRYSEADTVDALLAKIKRYNHGLADGNDHIDGRGTAKSQAFPMLNSIRAARGSGSEATLDDISITYQRFVRNLEDYVQASRRVEFVSSVRRLAEKYPKVDIDCSFCLSRMSEECVVFLVVACGHILCPSCKFAFDAQADAALCPVDSCGAYCKNSPILLWSDLCTSPEDAVLCDWNKASPLHDGRKSEKLEAIVETLKIIPGDDHALIFVPFVWLASRLVRRFEEEDISCLSLVEETPLTEREASKIGQAFKDGLTKVLLLNSTDVSCAGINLTIANHVIFAAPSLEQDEYRRNQGMRQAVGRCVRPGQTKTVYIYHLMVENTIEEKILRDYAQSREDKDNSLKLYFEHSPKPWWLSASGKASNASPDGGDETSPPMLSLPSLPNRSERPTAAQPKPLAPAGGLLPSELNNQEGDTHSPDLWKRLYSLLSSSKVDAGDDFWKSEGTLRSAVAEWEKLGRDTFKSG